jgi:isocitrate lyase
MQRSSFLGRKVAALGAKKGVLSSRSFSMSFVRLSEEDAQFEEEVKKTEQWFASSRFADIKRPYAAASVVEKRGTLPVIYPCDYQAQKLWALLQKYATEKKPLTTMGAIDPIQMTQMAPYQEVLYVSGWACSSVLASGTSP